MVMLVLVVVVARFGPVVVLLLREASWEGQRLNKKTKKTDDDGGESKDRPTSSGLSAPSKCQASHS
jgi:hypothetical protein